MINIKHNNSRKSDTGFIYVASRNRLYYELGLISCQTLRDYHPDAHVTLFTHEKFLDKRSEIFDTVITNIPIHMRAKMWCMARTPYERTLYNDCDSMIQHKDVRKIHDFLDQDDGYDMFFGNNLVYTVGNLKWAYIDKAGKISVDYHGSLCGYRKTDLTLDFHQTWFDKYLEQIRTPWPYSKDHYKEWQQFDMFTLWRLSCKRFPEFERFNKLRILTIPRRFNTTGQDLPEDKGSRPVIIQVDRGTWRKMPDVWPIVEKGMNDENHKVEQSSAKDPVIRYN